MKYLHQALLIFLFTALGELLHSLIPLPIPASIYGMILLFAALALKIVRVEAVADVGNFLTSLLPLLFVVPMVSLTEYWQLIQQDIWVILAIILVSTVLVFATSGWVTRWLVSRKKGENEND